MATTSEQTTSYTTEHGLHRYVNNTPDNKMEFGGHTRGTFMGLPLTSLEEVVKATHPTELTSVTYASSEEMFSQHSHPFPAEVAGLLSLNELRTSFDNRFQSRMSFGFNVDGSHSFSFPRVTDSSLEEEFVYVLAEADNHDRWYLAWSENGPAKVYVKYHGGDQTYLTAKSLSDFLLDFFDTEGFSVSGPERTLHVPEVHQKKSKYSVTGKFRPSVYAARKAEVEENVPPLSAEVTAALEADSSVAASTTAATTTEVAGGEQQS